MLKSIVKAIEKAHGDYEDMSGEWLWTGAEYFLTVGIAKRLKKKKLAHWVTIETPVESGYMSFHAGPRNRAMRSGGRFDIALWNEEPTITDVIEVKSSVHHSMCRADLERLAAIVKRTKSTRGLFAYYSTEEKATTVLIQKWLTGRAKALELLASEVASAYGVSIETLYKVTPPEEFDGKFSAALCMWIGFDPC
jgi:hypothetical protein